LDGVFRCLDLNGNVVWSYDTESPIVGSAAIENGIVYFLTTSNLVYEFTLSGTHVRSFQIANSILRPTARFTFALPGASTLLVVDDMVYPGCTTAFFTAYNATTGEKIFESEQPNILGENAPVSALYADDPKIEGERIYCPAGPTEACGDANTGKNIWSAWGGWEIFSSLCYGGYGMGAFVYGGSQSYSITCWNATDGTPVSWYTTGGQVESSPAIYNGRLYVGSADRKLYCFYNGPVESTNGNTNGGTDNGSTDTNGGTTDGTTYTTDHGTAIPIEHIYIIVAVVAIVIIAVLIYMYYRRER
jgi:outer membrane protein assembly factor BamB